MKDCLTRVGCSIREEFWVDDMTGFCVADVRLRLDKARLICYTSVLQSKSNATIHQSQSVNQSFLSLTGNSSKE